ncbi:MAG: hypothetical protein RI101_10520 [Nitrospira sp.]|nr:hypothetical protein [Nitrospira sp.]
MRAAKKSPLKPDQKSTALNSKRGGADYSKKAALLEDAIAQMNAGKYGRSSAALKELLALDPLNLEARRLFATLHLRLGSLLPARQAFEALANEALERQDYWLAESLLREYLVAGPRCVPFIEKLGIVYQEKGDELAAAEEFGKAIDVLLEDPDTENPNKPTQLYAKIRELAPASPPAFRLANYFDAQTGELIVRPAAAPAELSVSEASPSELVEPAMPEVSRDTLLRPDEPVSGVMPWDRVGEEGSSAPSSGYQSDITDWQISSPLPESAQGQIEAESASGADPRTDYSSDSHATEAAAVGEPVVSSESTSQAPIPDSPALNITSESIVTDTPLSRVEEGPQAVQPAQPIESVPAQMPWDQVQEVTVTIPPVEASSGVESRPMDISSAESPAVTASEGPWSYDANGPQTPSNIETAADSVSAPMPWDQVQDVTVTIPHADESSGIETRSASSVATESPFFALSDAVQAEPQAGSLSAWTAPDTASARPEAASPDLPPEASFPSHSVEEPVSTGEAAPAALASPADAPLSAAVEPMDASTTWEQAQELSAGPADSPQEPVSGEAPISGPPPADSISPSENPPLPEKTETPKNTGFSWESIFSTWKYGPSSSSSKKPVHLAPVDAPRETGVLLPPAESVAPAAAVHEAPAADPTPVMETPPEPVAQAIISEQAQEVPITIPLVEPVEHRPADSAVDMAVAPAEAIAEIPQEVAPAVDQPEALVLPTPTMADTIEPVLVPPSPEIGTAASWGDSSMEMAAEPAPVAEPAMEAAPPVEPLPQEVSSPAAVHSEPPVQPDEFRFVASGGPASLDSAPEAALREVFSPAVASPDPLVQPDEFRTISAREAISSVADEEREELLSPASLGVTPLIPPEACQVVSAGEPAAVSEPVLNKEEQLVAPQVLSHDAIPMVESPVYERSEGTKESPGVSHSAAAVEPAHHAVDLAGPSAVSPVSVPAVEDSVPAVPQPPPVPEQEAWVRTGESVRLVDSRRIQSARPAARDSGEPASAPVASAVDALFQSSGRMARTHTSEQATAAKPRPRIGAKLARVGLALSAFIGSCFSTSQALIMSLVGLVAVVGALAAIAIGAVGVAWVIMEEKPSPAFQSLTAAPQHSPMDSRKNGYVLLLGFDAEAGADPIQAGYERKPGVNEEEALSACLGGPDGHSGGGPLNATASVADGWFRSSNPVAQFKTKADGLKDWIGQAQSSIGRYRQWLKMPFEDWGYGQAVAPPCAAILFAHRLYIAEGFASGQPADSGIHRLQEDMEAWRTALGQAKTLPVKMLAVHALQDDLAVASGLLVQADFDNKDLPALATMLRPLDQVESSMRWPMQSELAAASQAADAQLKGDHGDDVPWHVMVAKWLPLPKQRRLNEYAAYYDASSKAAGEGRHGAMPKRAAYIKNPPATAMDYLTNPIENIVGIKPLSSWEQYNGMVIDTDARLRLASVQAWLRRGSQEGDLVTRIAKAGQRFYDPYTGMPMLVNPKRGVIYSVGHDGKDQDADSQQDVVVSVPPSPSSSGSAKGSVNSGKPK